MRVAANRLGGRYLIAGLLAAGCAAPARIDVASIALRPAGDFDALLVEGWQTELPAEARPRWRTGDALRYGLRLERGSEVRQWTVELTLLDGPDRRQAPGVLTTNVNGTPVRIESRPVRITVEVFDSAGKSLQRTESSLGDRILATGPAALCRLAVEPGGGPDRSGVPGGREEFARSVFGIVSLFEALQQCDALAPVLWEVVDRPSLLSVLFHGGVSLTLRADLERIVPATAGICGSGPGWELPIAIHANGSPALAAKLVCVEPRRPLQLAAGILAVEAVCPSDASRRFSLRLLGLR
jgi:hypothetical protein